MIRNYLKFTLRNLRTIDTIGLVHILSFSIALGCAVVCAQYLINQNSLDDFHTDKDQIFMLTQKTDRGGNIAWWESIPLALPTSLKNDFPSVQYATPIYDAYLDSRYGENIFNEKVQFVNQDYFKIFNFPLESGSFKGFSDQKSIVISSEVAQKYFGDGNPIGEVIELIGITETPTEVTVGGVFASFPENNSFHPDFLIHTSIAGIHSVNPSLEEWYEESYGFIKMQKTGDPANLRMEKYVEIQNEADPGFKAISFPLVPFENLALASNDFRGVFFDVSSPEERRSVLLLTILILIISGINYINLALASSSRRLKEIGVRKVLGSSRTEIIKQFIFENLVLTLFSMGLGMLLAGTVFISGFNVIFGSAISLDFQSLTLWGSIFLLIIVVSFISSLYPAIIISSFKPSVILKGKFKIRKNTMTHIFLGFQMVVSILLISTAITFTVNSEYLINKDWGYKKEGLLIIPNIYDPVKFENIETQLSKHSSVVSTAGSEHLIGQGIGWTSVRIDGEERNIYHLGIGTNYFETFKLNLIEGRMLNPESREDEQHNVVVNQAFLDTYGYGRELNELNFIINDSIKYHVVGVVEDFHYYAFYEKISPVFIYIAPKQDLHHLAIRFESGKTQEINEYAKTVWSTVFPYRSYDGFFQSHLFDSYLNKTSNHVKFIVFISSVSILLSLMGLYGMVSLSYHQRISEFSIRKVLGAGTRDMLGVMLKKLTLFMGISILIAIPASLLIIDNVMESIYTYHIHFNYSILLFGVLLMVLFTYSVVSTLIRKVLVSNPVKYINEN